MSETLHDDYADWPGATGEGDGESGARGPAPSGAAEAPASPARTQVAETEHGRDRKPLSEPRMDADADAEPYTQADSDARPGEEAETDPGSAWEPDDAGSGSEGQPEEHRSHAEAGLGSDAGPVLPPTASSQFRRRWHEIQAEFVDDPRHAVEDADRLVADLAQAFTAGVAGRREQLTTRWARDGRRETEQLRLTMHEYRAMVDRILQDF